MSNLEATRIEHAEQAVRLHQDDAVDKLRDAVQQVSHEDYKAVYQQVAEHDKRNGHTPLVELNMFGELEAKPLSDLMMPEKDHQAVTEMADCLVKQDFNHLGQLVARFEKNPKHLQDLMSPLRLELERDQINWKYSIASPIRQSGDFTVEFGYREGDKMHWHEMSTNGTHKDFDILVKF